MGFSTLGGGLGLVEPVNQVIRSTNEWTSLYLNNTLGDIAFLEYPPPFPYDVDFSTDMVVIVSTGERDFCGRYTESIAIESISVERNIIVIRYVRRIPPDGFVTIGDHAYPAHIVKTVRVDLETRFIPRTEVIEE